MLSMLGKNTADNILKRISYFFPPVNSFDISYKLSLKTIYMKCQSLFSEKKKYEIIINSSSPEFVQGAVTVNNSVPCLEHVQNILHSF